MKSNMPADSNEQSEIDSSAEQFGMDCTTVVRRVFTPGAPFSETPKMIHKLVDAIDVLVEQKVVGAGHPEWSRARAQLLIGTLASLLQEVDTNLSLPTGLASVLAKVQKDLTKLGVKMIVKTSSDESLPSNEN